ncbi:uncharacterized protein BO87DRAFT_341512 [Aspergillus neoniger CBS 115656]
MVLLPTTAQDKSRDLVPSTLEGTDSNLMMLAQRAGRMAPPLPSLQALWLLIVHPGSLDQSGETTPEPHRMEQFTVESQSPGTRRVQGEDSAFPSKYRQVQSLSLLRSVRLSSEKTIVVAMPDNSLLL